MSHPMQRIALLHVARRTTSFSLNSNVRQNLRHVGPSLMTVRKTSSSIISGGRLIAVAMLLSMLSMATQISNAQSDQQQYATTTFCRCELEGENVYPETALWERYYSWSARFNQPTTGGVFDRRKWNENDNEGADASTVAERSSDVVDREVPSRDGPDRMFDENDERRRHRQLLESVFREQFQPLDRGSLSDRNVFVDSEEDDKEENVGPQSIFSVLNRIQENPQEEDNEGGDVERNADAKTEPVVNEGPQSVYTVLDRIQKNDEEKEELRDEVDEEIEPPKMTSSTDFVVVNGVTILPRFHEACRGESHRRALQQLTTRTEAWEDVDGVENAIDTEPTEYVRSSSGVSRVSLRRSLQMDNYNFKRFNAARYWNKFFENLLGGADSDTTSTQKMMKRNQGRKKRSYHSLITSTRDDTVGNGAPTSPPLFLCPVQVRPTGAPSQEPSSGGGGFATDAPTISPQPTPFTPNPSTSEPTPEPTTLIEGAPSPAPVGLGSDAPSLVGSNRPSIVAITDVPTSNIVASPTSAPSSGNRGITSDQPSDDSTLFTTAVDVNSDSPTTVPSTFQISDPPSDNETVPPS